MCDVNYLYLLYLYINLLSHTFKMLFDVGNPSTTIIVVVIKTFSILTARKVLHLKPEVVLLTRKCIAWRKKKKEKQQGQRRQVASWLSVKFEVL